MNNFKFGVLFMLVAVFFMPQNANSAHNKDKIGVRTLTEGDGTEAVRHSKISVHYTGWLQDGTKFDSSLDRGIPFEFTIGIGQVIPGWDIGVEGMKAGEKRELIVPSEFAYGKKGAGNVIPPDATLKFEISLLSVIPPKYSNIDNKSLRNLLSRNVKIIDLRRQDEWDKTGVISGSKKLTAFDGQGNFIQSFPSTLQKNTKPGEEIILICQTGSRSAAIANMLVEQAGYTKVYNVKDGIAKWIADGNPVIR